MSRDLSYPTLLVVLLTAKLPSILDCGAGVSFKAEEKAVKENSEENTSHKAQFKKTQTAKNEADEMNGVSVKTERKTAKENKEKVISCKAQSKKTQNAKGEAEQIDNQDNVTLHKEDNCDGKSQDNDEKLKAD